MGDKQGVYMSPSMFALVPHPVAMRFSFLDLQSHTLFATPFGGQEIREDSTLSRIPAKMFPVHVSDPKSTSCMTLQCKIPFRQVDRVLL